MSIHDIRECARCAALCLFWLAAAWSLVIVALATSAALRAGGAL